MSTNKKVGIHVAVEDTEPKIQPLTAVLSAFGCDV